VFAIASLLNHLDLQISQSQIVEENDREFHSCDFTDDLTFAKSEIGE
jgi:hypothetical protein